MGMSVEDLRASKFARSLFAKRGLDVTRCDIRVNHGVCYIRGQVQRMSGIVINDLEAELENCAKVLRGRSEIKDVVLDVAIRR